MQLSMQPRHKESKKEHFRKTHRISGNSPATVENHIIWIKAKARAIFKPHSKGCCCAVEFLFWFNTEVNWN